MANDSMFEPATEKTPGETTPDGKPAAKADAGRAGAAPVELGEAALDAAQGGLLPYMEQAPLIKAEIGAILCDGSVRKG